MWLVAAVTAVVAPSLLLLGLWLGWTARDRVAVARSEERMPLVTVPLKDPIEIPLWTSENDSSEQ